MIKKKAFDEPASSEEETQDIRYGMEKFEKLQFRTAAYQKMDAMTTEYPAHIKSLKDMELKDVVKENLLPFFPAKSLVRFRLVSKEWDRWIASPFLAYKQSYSFQDISGFFVQHNSTDPTFVTLSRLAYGVPVPCLEFLPEIVEIRSSSHGLLLCQGLDENSYYICNPVNKDWKLLPEPGYYHGSQPAVVLAFEPSVLNMSAHYQVIVAVTLLDQPIVYFEMYSSQSKCWRRPAADCFELTDKSLESNGFYIKGIAYWLSSNREVLAFDPKNELAGVLYLPLDSQPGGILAEMHGELCYISARDQRKSLYVFDIYGGMEMSFKCSISVNLEGNGLTGGGCQILAFIENNVLICAIGHMLVSYEVSGDNVTVISRGEINGRMRCLPYVNSLVCVA